MTPWTEAIALWLADFYLAATIVLVIACSALCFIKQPARRMAVSWGTLVSLLLAAVLCQSTSRPRVDPRQLFARHETVDRPGEASEPALTERPVSDISLESQQGDAPQTAPLQQADLSPPGDVVAESAIAVEPASSFATSMDSRTIANAAVLGFLIGAVLVAARLAAGAWQASRLIRKSRAAAPALIEDLRAIVGSEARLPRLRLNARLVTPVATGALRPTIVLPERFIENSARGELHAVLGHEWAHIRNGDLWLLAFDRCLFPVLWAHPVYWWLRRRVRQDQEFLADAAAASLIGPAEYAAHLVAWARKLAGVRRIVVSNAVGIWERPSGFALRISTILHQSDRITLRCSGRVRTAVVGCVAALSLIATSVSVRPPNAESAPPQKPASTHVVDTEGQPSQKSASKQVSATDAPWELRGTVVTEAGAPAGDVLVTVRNFPFVGTARSAADGRFSLTVSNAPAWIFMVTAKDSGGLRQASYVYSAAPPWPPSGPSSSPVRLVMKTPREIPVSVTDAGEQPVAGATVGACAHMLEVATETSDSQGRAVLRVPTDVELEVVFAAKPDIGLDYFAYRKPGKRANNPYAIAADTKSIKFVLNGARTARLRIVDGNQRPLPGVRVSPWYFECPRKGDDFNVSAMETFTKTTNAAGGATFHVIPADNWRKTPFTISKPDYAMSDRPMFDPDATAEEIRVVLLHKEVVRGSVSFPDGRPAAGATVAVAGEGFGSESYQGETTCDEGGQFEIRVVPEMFYAFVATSGRFASPRRTCVVRAQRPIEPLQLVVQPGARVHGRWTLESDNRPVASQSLALFEREVNDDYSSLPIEARIPNPKHVRKYLVPRILRRPKTDDQGRFEFFVAPGSYQLSANYFNGSVAYGTRPLGRDNEFFNITDQQDFEINFRSAPLDRRDLTGRVVLKADLQKAVANVAIEGVATEEKHMGDRFKAVSDSQGTFQTRTAPSEMLVYAATEDRSQSAIVRITADAKDIVLPVAPTASAHGRLIDRSTGQPLADRVVASGIFLRWGQFSSWYFGSRIKTDRNGEFVVNHLTLGWKWELSTEVTMGVGEHAFESPRVVASVTPESPGLVELSDLKVSIPESSVSSGRDRGVPGRPAQETQRLLPSK
jgi:beta-lactamase regulating signal transducer with metallopeptidase domain